MRIAVLSDIHFPLHSPVAWNLTLKILPDLNIDKVLLLGDIVDFEPLSRFLVPPDRRLQLQEEFDVAKRELARLRKVLPKIPFEFMNGNHEDHLNRFLYQKAPELFGLDKISVRGFLELDAFDIQCLKPERPKQEGKLLFIHGHEVQVGSVNVARNLYYKVNCNVVAGHHHAEGKYIHTLGSSLKQEGSWINSCLRGLRPSWAPYSHWTLGFLTVDFSAGGWFHVEQALFLKRSSKLWTKVDRKEYQI